MSKEENVQFTRCCNVMLDMIKKYGAVAKEQCKENTNRRDDKKRLSFCCFFLWRAI